MKESLASKLVFREKVLVLIFVMLAVSAAMWVIFLQVMYLPTILSIEKRLNVLTSGVTTTEPLPSTDQQVIPVSQRVLPTVLPDALVKQPESTAWLIKKTKESDASGIFTPDQRIGQVLALTNDGWFLAHEKQIDSLLSNYLVVTGGKTAALTKGIKDSSTGFVYLKTTISTASVASLVRPELVEQGITVYIESTPKTYIPVSLTDKSIVSGNQSSEIASRQLGLALPESTKIIGSPVRDEQGRVLGIVHSYDVVRGLWLASPLSSVGTDLTTILQTGSIQRATLGIRGYDLSDSILTQTTSTAGFFIKTEKKALPAVSLDGPAYRQLVEGDIIQRVERDMLNGSRDLAELLLDFRPGATVTFYGIRQQQPFQAQIVLGKTTSTTPLK